MFYFTTILKNYTNRTKKMNIKKHALCPFSGWSNFASMIVKHSEYYG